MSVNRILHIFCLLFIILKELKSKKQSVVNCGSYSFCFLVHSPSDSLWKWPHFFMCPSSYTLQCDFVSPSTRCGSLPNEVGPAFRFALAKRIWQKWQCVTSMSSRGPACFSLLSREPFTTMWASRGERTRERDAMWGKDQLSQWKPPQPAHSQQPPKLRQKPIATGRAAYLCTSWLQTHKWPQTKTCPAGL